MERTTLEAHDDSLSGVIERAHELQMRNQELAAYEAFVQAAEEAGIPRESVMQALRERLATAPKYHPGQFVMAPGADGFLYVAKVGAIEDSVARIKFANGSETAFPTDELRPFALLPNQKVQVNLPGWGGWYGATVSHFNEQTLSLTVNASGMTQTVTLEALRMRPQKDGETLFDLNTVVSWAVGALAIGGALGSLITWLVMR